MSPIFTVIIIVLALLAILDLIVGVSNDAVNFLNSALGAKVAPMKVILAVASVGILIGVITSNGMMEVARSGVIHPEMFTFHEIMFLFAGVMLTDVILLNTFNSLGLPTSTTVSLISELLGSAVAVASFKIFADPDLSISDLGTFINSGKALVIISGILLSVVIAFTVGSIIMYFSRILFTFRYAKALKRYGAVWCGISIVGILYFAIFQGMKSSGLFSADVLNYINHHIVIVLLGVWVVSSIVMWVLQMLKVDIMKITILAGTMALALAFAGNDLVNFIGVPLAGLDSYMMALNNGGNEQMLMGDLAKPAQANIWFLVISGLVMILTLFFSRSAMRVAETQLNLSSQHTVVGGGTWVGFIRPYSCRCEPDCCCYPYMYRHIVQVAAFYNLRSVHGCHGFFACRPSLGARQCSLSHYRCYGGDFGLVLDSRGGIYSIVHNWVLPDVGRLDCICDNSHLVRLCPVPQPYLQVEKERCRRS